MAKDANDKFSLGGSTELGGNMVRVKGVDPNAASFQWSRVTAAGVRTVLTGANRQG
jgi:hypothetical protein